MRRISLTCTFVILAVLHLLGQEQVTIYYDSLWRITRASDAVYKRAAEVTFKGDSLVFDGEFSDMLLDGTIRAEGQYVKGNKVGRFSFYHPNGVLEVTGKYEKNEQIGLWEYYNDHGGDKQTIIINGDEFVVEEFYDEKGKKLVQEGTGNWRLLAPVGDQYALLDAYFEAGNRVDTWNFRYYKGSRIFREKYDDQGNLIEGIDYRGKGKSTYQQTQFSADLFEIPRLQVMENLATDENFYGPDAIRYIREIAPVSVIHEGLKPTYEGGIESFYNYVLENYRYPGQAYAQKLEGQVIVNFLLTRDGKAVDFRILRGISQDLNAEAVRLIKSAPGWQPATHEDTAVDSRMTIPINFRIGN